MAELRKFPRGRDGFLRIISKSERRALERRGKKLGQRLTKARNASRRRRKHEARIALALLGPKDLERSQLFRKIWKRRVRAPIGTRPYDRAIIHAMWPPAWLTRRQIGERIDWARVPTRRASRPSRRPGEDRLVHPLKRLAAHGVVETEARDVNGFSTPRYYRLTPAGVELHNAIAAGRVPNWESMQHIKPRPVGDNDAEAKTLCAMEPGAWASVGTIRFALGVRKRGPGGSAVANAMGRLLRAGAVTQAQHPDRERLGPTEPRFFYKLTELGEQAREAVLLIG